MATPVKPIPDSYTAITPYLTVRNAAGAIEFYEKVKTYPNKNCNGARRCRTAADAAVFWTT